MACSGPSTMRYKDRLSLRNESAFEYNKLYATNSSSDVFQRLSFDASTRSANSSLASTGSSGSGTCTPKGQISGFVSNTTPCTYSRQSFKAGLLSTDELPIESLHPLSARKFLRDRPIEYRAAMRPTTETTNQTLRMLGTYSTDHAHAQRLGIFIPAGCPGGPGHYHPDVGYLRGGTTRRIGNTSTFL